VRARGGGRLCDEPELIELDHGDPALTAHREVREPAVLAERHLIGVVADGDLPRDPAGASVDHLEDPGLVAGDVHLGAVRRDREPVWLGFDLDAAELAVVAGIDLDQLVRIAEADPEAVGAAVASSRLRVRAVLKESTPCGSGRNR
jgi:hypothetical protein